MERFEVCSHPARLKGRDGVLRCIVCGAEIEAGKPAEDKPTPRRATMKAKEGKDAV